jgi:hypothetical protein
VGWGGGTEGHPRIIRIAGKSQTIHTWSDRASNYFVSGEDYIKPGSFPAIQSVYEKAVRSIILRSSNNFNILKQQI